MACWDDLPGEVRNQIYRILLVNDRYVDTEAHRLGRALRTDLLPVILRVCKRVYKEVSSILYGENLFRFNYPYSGCYPWEYHLWGDYYSNVNPVKIKKVGVKPLVPTFSQPSS